MRILSTTFLGFLLLLTVHLTAQTATNIDELNRLSVEFEAQWEANQLKVQEYAKANNVLTFFETEQGVLYQMVNVIDGQPVYYKTDNLGAAKTTRADELWEGGEAGLAISGEGYDKMGEWDGGGVLATHQEFTDQGESRVNQMDNPGSTHYHATHVGGTLIAAGVSGNAKGMAYAGNLRAYDWNNDLSEMVNAAANGLEISNHSYGSGAGWENNGSWNWLGLNYLSTTEDYKFGFYNAEARQLDLIAYNAPNYLIFRSAGNERGEGPSYAGTGDNPEKDGGTDGYDCIQPEKGAKNVMTIGAVLQVSNYTGPGSVQMSSFSSWGPMDDGRIKPDIVAKGVAVYSTDDGGNTSYQTMSGTSMSSPNAAGTAALLQIHYQDLNEGEPMRSATLKGLIIHTADEAGDHIGPDYVFGWGLMNAKRAAAVISENLDKKVIDEQVLAQNTTFVRVLELPEDTSLRVTICWTDPAGSVLAPALNDRTPILVNDLDLRIVDNDNNVYYPYKLNPDDKPAEATTDSENRVDNVEMIYLPNAPAGTYSVYVDHEGDLDGDEQAFSIISSFDLGGELPPTCSPALSTPEDGDDNLLLNQYVSWVPGLYATTYDVYFGTDGEGVETPTNIYNRKSMSTNGFEYLMDPTTTYYLQVVPRNSIGAASGCDQIWSFSSMEEVNAYPYFQDFAEIDDPLIPEGYQSVDSSTTVWLSSDFGGHNDENAMICLNEEDFVETDFNNWLMSPPFFMTGGKEYDVSCFYLGIIPTTQESFSVYWSYTPYVIDFTNLIAQNDSILGDDWMQSEGTIMPEQDTLVYLGFHVNSKQGFGVLLDDIYVEGWTVGTGLEKESRDAKIFGYSDKIFIQANAEWIGADIRIVNIMGQEIYKGTYQNNMAVDIRSASTTGLYIVTLFDGKETLSKKVMIR